MEVHFMQYRKHNDFEISEVGIGCYALSGVYGRKDVGAFKEMLRRAFELGVNFFDTAEGYGEAEQILGEVVKPFRSSVYIATKVGVKEGVKANLTSAYVKSACEESLGRLGTDYVDLYQVHFDDPDTPVEDTVEALDALVREGKIRHYGMGHLPVERVETYFEVGHVLSVLMELSAVAREARERSLPLCREHGVGAIAFSVTGRGLLTGRFRQGHTFEARDIRNIDPLFQRERFQSGLRVAEKLAEVGGRYDKTPAQTAIAWVLAQPGIICALTGPSTVPHLEENVRGSGWSFSAEDLEELEGFLQQEDEWLRREQGASIRRILTASLADEPEQAFTDLVYVIETAVLLGLVAEKGVLPVLQELFGVREGLDEDARPKLESIRERLRELVYG
jgi:aryl-alcohol dehydrogenase-like predicted oxidoreductase